MKKTILPNTYKGLEDFFNDLVYVVFDENNVQFTITAIDTSHAPEYIWVSVNTGFRFLILIDIVHDDEEEITVEYDILVDWI
jgi:hypothetical protein